MLNPYKMFDTTIKARKFVSPSMLRVTLSGPDLADIGTTGLDQRFKLVPCDGEIAESILAGDPWYETWRNLPDEVRPIARTYTFSGLRPENQEIDFDVVLVDQHPHGPGADFCLNAPIGTRTLLCGPIEGAEGHDTIGVTWLPNNDVLESVLIVADETALPAARAILASLSDHVKGLAVIEVPVEGDTADLARPSGVELRWCVRDRGESALANLPFAVDDEYCEQLSDEPYWFQAEPGQWLGWVAGEAHWVAAIRRGAKRAGISREHMSFMGYWRNDAGSSS